MRTVAPVLIGTALLFSGWLATRVLAQTDNKVPVVVNNGTQPQPELPDWLKLLGFGTGLVAGPGIAIWYLWYDVAKVKPRMERIHREQMAEMQARYIAQMKETEARHAAHWELANNNSRSDLHEITKGNREDNARFVAAIDNLANRVGLHECKFEQGAANGS